MKLTKSTEKDIRDTILTTFDMSFFVEAGAGAGKTTLIANRIVNQFKSGKFTPERIVAITFTNEATRSLKDRIASVLDDALSGTLTDEERDNLLNAKENLDLMQVSTIHKFCERILTEKGFNIGLPMGFELLDPEKENERFDLFFSKWAEKNIHYSDWNKMLIAADYKKQAAWRIMSLAKELFSLSADTNIKNAGASAYQKIDKEIDTFITSFRDKLDEAVKVLPFADKTIGFETIPDDYLTAYGKDMQTVFSSGNISDIFNKILTKPTTKSYIFKVTQSDPFLTDYVEKTFPDLKTQKARKEKVVEYIDEVKTKESAAFKYAFDDVNGGIKVKAEVYQIYVKFALDAANAYRDDFPSTLITNDKLLEKTKDLLASSDEIRDYFASKFDCIYVDEFQDTDHIQDEFIRMLASKPGAPGELRDGALFVVGDPKQSIYRFRGAEPNVYFNTKDYMLPLNNAYVCELTYNYRSDQSIIDWVNNSFSSKNITGDMQKNPYINMTKDPLTVPKNPLSRSNTVIKGVYQFKYPEKYEKGITTFSADADNVCKLITGMVGKVNIDNGGDPQPVDYSDFLLLCSNTYHMDEYAKAMEEYGIPYTMIAKVDASGNYYLNAFVDMYAFLVSPFDRVARRGAFEVLSLSGVSEPESILEELREDTKKLSGYGIIRYLIKHVDLIMKKDAETDIHERADLQRKLHQMTEKVLSSGYEDKDGVLKVLKDYVAGKIEKELVLNEKKGAVRFMDLHQAKGLEGNIVIWTNRYENRNYAEGRYRDGNDYYPDVKDKNDHGKPFVKWAASSTDKAISVKARADEESEKIRLEYVAATRAKHALIFMDIVSQKAQDGGLFSSGYSLTSLDSADIFATGVKPAPSSGSATPYTTESAEARRAAKKSAKDHSGDLYVSKTPSELEDKTAEKGRKDNETESDRVRGNILGLSIHRAFELLVERSVKETDAYVLPSEEISNMCILQALNENSDKIPEGEYDEYLVFLNKAIAVFKEWFALQDEFKNADVFFTELPFFYMTDHLGAGEKKDIPYWMHGESDLVIKLKDGSYHVIDYKSDDDTEFKGEAEFVEYLNKKYTPQIVEYKRAVSSIFGVGEDKVSASLISFSYMDPDDWRTHESDDSDKTMRVRETKL